jgi:phage tail-like protein
MDLVNSIANLFDSHSKLVKNSKFLVFIGILKLSFAKVSGFEQDIEKQYFVEGGNNDYGIQMVAPHNERHTLRFERGVQTWSPVLTRMKPGVAIPLGITILMLNNENIPVHSYHASDCIVTKWQVADFDANNGTVLIETFEVSYTTCDRTNLQLI